MAPSSARRSPINQIKAQPLRQIGEIFKLVFENFSICLYIRNGERVRLFVEFVRVSWLFPTDFFYCNFVSRKIVFLSHFEWNKKCIYFLQMIFAVINVNYIQQIFFVLEVKYEFISGCVRRISHKIKIEQWYYSLLENHKSIISSEKSHKLESFHKIHTIIWTR